MSELLPGTEVRARGLQWEVVLSERLGPQTLFQPRGLQDAVLGQEIDLPYPFEAIELVGLESLDMALDAAYGSFLSLFDSIYIIQKNARSAQHILYDYMATHWERKCD